MSNCKMINVKELDYGDFDSDHYCETHEISSDNANACELA